MNAGTLVFLLVVILIAFGFVGSEYIDTQQRAQDLQSKMDNLIHQVEQNQVQLISCREQSKKDAQKIQDLQQAIGEWETNTSDLNHQINELKSQNAILQLQGSIIDFLRSNPVLLVGALIAQLAASAFRSGRILGLKSTGMVLPPSDEYVRLSSDERAWVIHKRRNEQSRKYNT